MSLYDGIGDVGLTDQSFSSRFTSDTSRPSVVTSLHGVGVFIEPTAGDDVPSRVTARTGRLIGRIEPVGSTSERWIAAGVRDAPISVRSGPARLPVVTDAVAAQASALSLEDRPAARRVAEPHRRRVGIDAESCPHEGDEPAHLVGAESKRRHAGARNAARHQRRQRVIGCRARQPAAPQVDAADADAVRPVTAARSSP